jgi:hypothetical protein
MFEDAIIHMGLMPNEFWDITLYEYRCMICRYRFNQAKSWEHTRRTEWAVLQSQSTKKINVVDLFPLLTDPLPKKPKTVDPEERKRLLEQSIRTAAIFNQQMNK